MSLGLLNDSLDQPASTGRIYPKQESRATGRSGFTFACEKSFLEFSPGTKVFGASHGDHAKERLAIV
jgi:hypothetical protein